MQFLSQLYVSESFMPEEESLFLEKVCWLTGYSVRGRVLVAKW